MKILIDNSGYELRNFGDIAMLVATVERIKSLAPEAIIYVFTKEPNRLKDICPDVQAVDTKGRNDWLQTWSLFGGLHRLCPEGLKESLKKFEFSVKSNFLSTTLFIIGLRLKFRKHDSQAVKDFISLLKSVDIVMATGGGFVNDEFSVHAQNVLKTIYMAQKINKRTAMVGQGLGPINDLDLISIAKKVFPKLELVGLRESTYSYEIAERLGARKEDIIVTGDDAVLLAYRNRKTFNGNNIGFNLRVAKYSNLDRESVAKIKKIVTLLSEKEGGEIVPIAISIHEGDSDIHSLEGLLDTKIKHTYPDSLNSVIDIIGECKLVITGSYHAGVFALSQGIPVIGIAASDYYRQKFEGLRNQFKSDSCYIVDIEHSLDFVTFEKIIEKLIDNSQQNYSSVLTRAVEQINSSDQVVKRLMQLVKNED
ncbi:polysaccharide pyruvyl transferase family protein [Methylophaga thalassica]|uniref:polysaccharide pyruvyl transferase family protein n=1 Tax=Methylophaga aminisulfidivorans TaxID=230105 RepID=UPI0024E26F8E|nr:polysaccharide pyruvyl transferase family protein [Methylophaga aminisulfidivorans]